MPVMKLLFMEWLILLLAMRFSHWLSLKFLFNRWQKLPDLKDPDSFGHLQPAMRKKSHVANDHLIRYLASVPGYIRLLHLIQDQGGKVFFFFSILHVTGHIDH